MRSSPLDNFPIDTFLSEYWQKKPLLIRNALPNIISPVDAETLAGLACEDAVESRIIIQHQNRKDWELKHGPFDEKTFATLPKSHWTLLVQAVDHYLPKAANFLDLFSFIPHWRIDDLMISYASNGGGVGPHFDNYDVFLVQTSGKRKWELGERYNHCAALQENLPVSILKDFYPIESWLLEPGDILYIPPGFGHNGIAEGDDCITCSVGFRAPSHNDILREYTDFLNQKISDSIRYNDPDLVLQDSPGEISKDTLEKIKSILQKYTKNDEYIADWFGRYVTAPKYSQESQSTPQETDLSCDIDGITHYLTAGGYLRRNESSRFAFEIIDSEHILFIDGDRFNDTNIDSNFIETLCNKIEFNIEDFTLSKYNLSLLLQLINTDVLYLTEK